MKDLREKVKSLLQCVEEWEAQKREQAPKYPISKEIFLAKAAAYQEIIIELKEILK